MALRYHGRGVTVDPSAPEPPGICDRCAAKYQLSDLQWQYDYRGNALVNLRILVCPQCLDEPDPYYLPRVLGPDPLPVIDPRPGFYAQQEDQPTDTPVPPTPRPTTTYTQLQLMGYGGRRYGSFTGR